MMILEALRQAAVVVMLDIRTLLAILFKRVRVSLCRGLIGCRNLQRECLLSHSLSHHLRLVPVFREMMGGDIV